MSQNRTNLGPGAQLLVALLIIASARLLAAAEASFVIFHTNDIHGRMEPEMNADGGGSDLGGFARLAMVVKKERAANPGGVLLLDAGDFMHGYPECDASRGMAVLTLMKAVGYDACCPGNHDFAFGSANLKLLSEKAGFPFVSCNIVNAGRDDPAGFIRPWFVKTAGGVRVGVAGITAPSSKWFNMQEHVADVDFFAARRVLDAAIAGMRKECDVVVLLSHMGFSSDKATAYKFGGIDIIIGGHSHTYVNPAVTKGTTLICQAGSHLKSAGRVDVVFDSGARRITRKEGRLIRLDSSVPDDDETAALVKGLRDPRFDEVVGETGEAFGHRSLGDSAFGRLVTDAMREETGADVAMIGGSSLHEGIRKGPVTRRSLYRAAPYGEALRIYSLTGGDIRTVLETAVYNGHPSIQVSGLGFSYDLNLAKRSRVVGITVGGRRIAESDRFKVVTTWYFARGEGEYGRVFKGGEPAAGSPYECLCSWFSRRKKATAPSPVRMSDAGASPMLPGEVVNVNSAGVEDLARLPGIGPAIAGRIIEARIRSGGFSSVEDLLGVKGIGPVLLEKIRPFVALDGGEKEDE